MKALVLSIVMLLVATTASAQENPPVIENNKLFILPNMIECGHPALMASIVKNYKEIPFALGATIIKRPDGTIMPAQLYMYVNPSVGSYSIIAQLTEIPVWCLVNSGREFRPAPFEKGI